MKVDDWYSYHQYLEKYPRSEDRRRNQVWRFRDAAGTLIETSYEELEEKLLLQGEDNERPQ